MNDPTRVFFCISTILGISFTITTLVLASKISDETKDDPLEEYDKKIKNLNKTENTTLIETIIANDELSKLSKFCQCGEKIMENICTEEQIVSGCYDVSENNKRTLLRYLEENCDTIGENIESKGGLSKAFDLNYGTVYNMAYGIYILLFFLLLYVIYTMLSCCCPKEGEIIFWCALFTYFVSLFLNFIFFIVMISSYYSGDTGKFLDYYDDCLKGKDKLMIIQDTYEKMKNISKYITAFVIINFLHIGLRIIDVVVICKTNQGKKKIIPI